MTLQSKITLAVAAVILGAGGTSTYIAHVGARRAYQHRLENDLRQFVITVQEACAALAKQSPSDSLAQKQALAIVSTVRSPGLSGFVLDARGRPLLAPTSQTHRQGGALQNSTEVTQLVNLARANTVSLLRIPGEVFGFKKDATVGVVRFEPWNWVLGVVADPSRGAPSYMSTATSSWWLALMTLAATIGLVVILRRLTLRPLRALASAARHAAEGTSNIQIDIAADPEILQVVEPVNRLIEQTLDRAAKLESFKEAIAQPMLTVDRELKITYANTPLAEMLGYDSPKELIGRNYEDVFGQISAQNARKIFRTREPIREIRRNLIGKDGQEIPVIGSGGCLFDRKGEPVEIVITYVDLRDEYERRQNYLRTQIAPIEQTLLAVSEGDLSQNVPEVDTPELQTLARALQESLERTRSMLASIQAASQAVATAADEIAAAVEQQAEGTEHQLRRAEEVAAAVAETSQVVHETANNTANASHHADKSAQKAREGAERVGKSIEVVHNMVETLQVSSSQLGQFLSSFRQIDDIVQMIEDIADRTNLLALNATIEAARAGEAGRGFSVVAAEIQKLAERTHTAKAKIRKLVQAITDSSTEIADTLSKGTAQGQEGGRLATESRRRMEEIVESSQVVQDMVRQIATATEQQSATADQIAHNLNSITEIARESNRTAEQIAKAGEELRHLVGQLNDIVGLFRTGQSRETAAVREEESERIVHEVP